ncbi:MAG TPA: glycosyltransferase, partial [Candidatus Saccharimonadales bacterium]|nr:glycosyltransferase [Candidatus Saccharimonadales bacterium]
MKYDLSILIPARNEMFTARTVQDIIEKKRGNTEVIVGMDGQWSDPGIPDHPDVRIIYVSQAIGQRAMTNRLARLSKAKYLMKVDAHCTFDEGFDVK